MNPGLLVILGFLAAAAAVLGIYSILSDFFLRDRARVNKRLDEEFRKRQREQAQKSVLFKDLSTLGMEAAEEMAVEKSWRQRMTVVIEQAGLELTPQRLAGFMAASGLLLAAVATLLSRTPFVGIPVGVLGALIPLGIVHLKRRRRLGRLLAQLPDAFELMSRCVRAGQTVSQSLQAVADEFDAPISAEFSFCYEQMNLGLPPELAMRDLARRTGLMEIKVFVLAMLVQQQTGGNLAELLDKLGTIVRERFRIQGKIKSLTAEGRLQAWVLLSLPPFLLLVVMMINPVYGAVLFAHPGILVTLLVFEIIGALWIRKIVNFEF
jgi:tight adherence protein B